MVKKMKLVDGVHVFEHFLESLTKEGTFIGLETSEDGFFYFRELVTDSAFLPAACVGEVDANETIVVGVAATGDETGFFHALEHVGYSGTLDSELVGDF